MLIIITVLCINYIASAIDPLLGRLWEQMLAEQAEQLRCLEVNDIQAKEEAVAQEELALIEQRNRASLRESRQSEQAISIIGP